MKLNKANMTFMKLTIFVVISMLFANKSVSQHYTEYEVKAAYIYNFTKFIELPQSVFQNENSTFVIGIFRKSNLGEIINSSFKDRTLMNRKWEIKYFNNPEEITQCHFLFVSDVDKAELSKILSFADKMQILTIGDNIEDFCEMGGIINFSKQYSKYRFEINNNSAIRKNITISSKLLSLAKIIIESENRF